MLDGASMVAYPGECVAVVARPGAGLTSLLLCGAGLLGPDRGNVRWSGSHAWGAARAAYAPPAPEGHHYLSVRAWLEFVADQAGDHAGASDPDVDDALRRTALVEFHRIRVGHLTPGVGARLAVAGALLADPRVLFVDRTGDLLSPPERAGLAAVFDCLRHNGVAIVLGTRHHEVASAFAPSRTLGLVAGRLAIVGARDGALELDVPLPVEARSRLALRVPIVYRRGRALRVPLERITAEQVLGECRALGIEVRASRVVAHDPPSRRRVAEGVSPAGSVAAPGGSMH